MEVWQQLLVDSDGGAARLVAEYGDRLFAAALPMSQCDHDAEELAFRALDRAVRKIRLYDPSRPFFTWLYTVMLNLRRMEARRRRVPLVPMGAAEDLPEPECAAPQARLPHGISDDDLLRAVRALSDPLREAVALRYFADRSVKECADALGVPVGTVKSRLANARAALAAMLDGKGGRKR